MEIELFYEEKGRGVPFIFLHGNGEDGSYFKKQTDFFQNKYRTIALDSRGHGKSPRGIAPLSIAQFSRDLYDFMCSLGISSAIILGFSDGANVAMIFAMEHPDMVKALILNGGNLCPEGVKRSTQFPIEIGYKIAKHFAKKSEGAAKNAEILGLMVNEPHIEPRELSKITAPTLVICGTRDMIKDSHTRLIAENIPNAELTILKGDHFIASKRSDEFNRVVDEFLSSRLADNNGN